MQSILAVDPGTDKSGVLILRATGGPVKVEPIGVLDNRELLGRLRESDLAKSGVYLMAIEMIDRQGMPAGREVFQTALWIGRFVEAWRFPARLVYRRYVKLHLCGTAQSKDPHVRQALLDMFPATGGGATPQVGTQKRPGPLFGVSSHMWSALAIAMYASQVEAKPDEMIS